jgi:hypothetical protein
MSIPLTGPESCTCAVAGYVKDKAYTETLRNSKRGRTSDATITDMSRDSSSSKMTS